jgi:gamma-glutamylcyclotransferase (GGCT)/AIG2-like uncharacterized protein YtfP
VTVYFAYGANMDPVHMAECCPGAVPLGPATLDGHRFAIAAGGYGTVHPAAGRQVLGVLWRLSDSDLAALDKFEEVPAGLYRRGEAVLRRPEGGAVEAMLYQATDGSPGRPAPGYLERILDVAAGRGFPPDYLAELRSHSAL